MYCPKCGKENPEDAQLCQSCSCALTQSSETTESVIIKTSGMGIASMVLGILSVFTFGITAIPAVILGIISLVQIEKSGGRLTGRAFGIVGIAVPVVVCFLAIGLLYPALNRARELGRRAVCLGNEKQLALAWVMYADENDGKLVNGKVEDPPPPTVARPELSWVLKGDPSTSSYNQEAAIKGGALWPYLKNPRVFHCPAGKINHSVTYQIVDSMNGFQQPDTVADQVWANNRGDLSRTQNKLVFIDIGKVRSSSYHVSYRDAKWLDMPPVQHRDGVTVGFADAHSEYWKWKGEETVKFGKTAQRADNYISPQSPKGKEDLLRLQIAVWGKLGYTPSTGE